MSPKEMDIRLRRALIALVIIYVFGSVVLKYLEHWTWIDAFYFTATLVSTIGIGDIIPSREITRVFLTFYSFIGVGIALYALSILVENRLHKKIGLGFPAVLNHTSPAKNNGKKNKTK